MQGSDKNRVSKKNSYIILLLLIIFIAGSKIVKSCLHQYKSHQKSLIGKEHLPKKYATTSPANGPQAKNAALPKEPLSFETNFLHSSNGEVVRHHFYTLSYIEKYEQAEWVCYALTKEELRQPNVPRSDWFNPDPLISTKSASHSDYKGSGYTRGHLVPAGDMSFDQMAMEETFYMSNMSPQLRGFNNGIWRELEEQTRDWTYQNNEVMIVSGPIVNTNPKFFKKKHIAIPTAFYKIIVDTSQPEIKAIAFIIPHEVSTKPLSSYAVSVDHVEEMTGINFFKKYNVPSIEKIESSFNINKWPISEARFRLRVEKWNNE